LDELGEASRVALGQVSVDSFSLRAVKGGADRRQSHRPGRRHPADPDAQRLSPAASQIQTDKAWTIAAAGPICPGMGSSRGSPAA
jgi:hypothetical protein